MLYHKLVISLVFLWTFLVIPTRSLPMPRDVWIPDQGGMHVDHTEVDMTDPTYKPNKGTRLATLPARTGRYVAQKASAIKHNAGEVMFNIIAGPAGALRDPDWREHPTWKGVSQEVYADKARGRDRIGVSNPAKANKDLAQQLQTHRKENEKNRPPGQKYFL